MPHRPRTVYSLTLPSGAPGSPGRGGCGGFGAVGDQRDTLVTLMKAELYGAAFGGHPVNAKEAKELLAAANGLLAQAAALT